MLQHKALCIFLLTKYNTNCSSVVNYLALTSVAEVITGIVTAESVNILKLKRGIRSITLQGVLVIILVYDNFFAIFLISPLFSFIIIDFDNLL
jgi:hypothetical protein